MPFLLVSTHARLEGGPTKVGDEHADPKLMEALDARLVAAPCTSPSYVTQLQPRVVLEKLELIGWKRLPQPTAMRWLRRVRLSTLVAVGAANFVVGTALLVVVHKYSQRWFGHLVVSFIGFVDRARQSAPYERALQILSLHERALQALGPPIELGALDLEDLARQSAAGSGRCTMRIPVIGRRDGGVLHVDASLPERHGDGAAWHVDKVALALDSRDSFVTIYDSS